MNKILNFHNIQNRAWLDSVLTYLKSKFTIIGLNEIESYYYEGKNMNNSCHISFDDGDNSFYEVSLPVLIKHRIPASLFVSPHICLREENFWFQEIIDYDVDEMKKIISEQTLIRNEILKQYSILSILKNLKIDQIWSIIHTYQNKFNVKSKNSQNMNVEKLLEVERYGLVTIGAHTNNHPILTNEDDEKSKDEISDSIEELANLLGHEIRCFAYPNGRPKLDFGIREMEILKNKNCGIAFSTEPKNFTSEQNPLAIPRYGFDQRSMRYILFKFFFGEYWDKFKNLTLIDEEQERMEIKNKMSLKNS
jgi:peptidoglycan/xylan/chitin deacetylase (PgdA/CDA1 family)